MSINQDLNSGLINGDQNGIVTNSMHNGASTTPITVNGSAQLGANAMFNLARIASSDQKQVVTANPIVMNVQPAGHVINLPQGLPNAVTAVSTSNQTVILSAPQTQQVRAVASQPGPGAAVRMGNPIIIPRGTNTISIPAGVLAPGTILMQNDRGQIVFVQRAPNHSNTIGTIPIQPNPHTGPVGTTSISAGSQVVLRQAVANVAGTNIRPQSTTQHIAQRPLMPAVGAGDKKEKTNKCKNFLETLMRLSSQQPQHIVDNVKNLIRGLLDGTVSPDAFTDRLQKELNSQKQPGLTAFLRESLPDLRVAYQRNELSIEGLEHQPANHSQGIDNATLVSLPTVIRPTGSDQLAFSKSLNTGAGQLIRPANSYSNQATPSRNIKSIGLGNIATVSAPPKGKHHLDLKDDDDINDVATMGGVNLSEETKNILAVVPEASGQLRSCKDDVFLSHTPLAQKIRLLALKKGVKEVQSEVVTLASHACEDRLRSFIEKLILISEHRLDVYKVDKRYEPHEDVRAQLKFLEEMHKLEKKRNDDTEREILLKAAKSRSKTEDPEKAELKLKAKVLKEQEYEEQKQIDANRTALAAIGPRKKPKLDMNESPELNGNVNSMSLDSSHSSFQAGNRPRLKRVNIRDMSFVLEGDKDYCKSKVLYQSFTK